MTSRALTAAVGASCAEIARELLSQPDFFEFHRSDLPEQPIQRPDLSRPRYDGSRSGDEAVNLRVGAMRLLGFSDRAIERECGVDRRTIPHRLAFLEKTARIPAVKDRVLVWTADAAERSGIVLGSLLDRAHDEVSIELAGMIKSVATAHGITVEKLQLLTGSATEIIEHREGAGREEQERWARENRLPIECESERISADRQQIQDDSDVRHEDDTSDRAGATAADQAADGRGGGAADAVTPKTLIV